MSNLDREPSVPMSQRKAVGIVILVFFIAIALGVDAFQKRGEEKRIPDSSTAQKKIDGINLPGLNILMKDMAKGSGFSGGSIIAALFFSIVGMAYFGYGKKTNQYLMLFSGIALMGYSYFIYDIIMVIIVGVELCCMPFVMAMIFE